MQINITALRRRETQLFRLVICCLVLVCLVGTLSKTVFAQTTYIITDGNKTTVHTSIFSDPEKVLEQAGHSLQNADRFTAQQTENGTTEIIIQRAQSIAVDNCGSPMTVISYGETVEALLTRLSIPVSGSYSFSHELTCSTYDGMTVRIVSHGEAEETYNVILPYEIFYVDDPLLAAGEEKIVSPGKPGEGIRTDTVLYENGVPVLRKLQEQTVVKEPSAQYVLRGTGEKTGGRRTQPLIGDGFLVTPEGKVLTFSHSDQFVATGYTHTDEGCDEITATGTTVRTGVVAVDPRLIPYFTKMYIVTNDGAYIYGESRAEDCGGAIQGKRLDLYFYTTSECFQFGIRDCTVYFLTD